MVLPIILFLTLTALDFGRVYLGYINLQNMARIAANFAANNPTAWTGGGDAGAQAQYRSQILSDGAASNCTLPTVSGVPQVPTPVFTDANGDGRRNLGDTVRVQIGCTFGVITPWIAQVVGGSVSVAAQSTFPVKTGLTGTGAGAGTGSAPVAAFIGNGVTVSPDPMSGTAVYAVDFRDTSGGGPTSWSWVFPGGLTTAGLSTSSARDPGVVTFATPGPHAVSLTAMNLLGSDTASMVVTVAAPSVVDFTTSPNPASGAPGLNVTFSDASTPGGTAYAWTFGAGEGAVTNPTNAPVTHRYNTTGDFTVTLTVTYPAPVGNVSASKTVVHIANSMCTVPSLNGVRFNNAQAIWQNSTNKFTGTVIRASGAPGGNFVITAQSLPWPLSVPCSSSVTVNAP
jgi:PKD repeat protein